MVRRVKAEAVDGGDEVEYVPTTSERLDKLGIYQIFGEICTELLVPIQESLLLKHYDSSWNKKVTLLINSDGGSLHDTFAFINILNFVKMPVETVAMGAACSSALMILMSGSEDQRSATDDCILMSHKYSDFVGEKTHSELIADRKGQDIVYGMMIKHYIRHSKYGQKNTVEKHLLTQTDTYMSSAEALKHGLIDKVVGKD